MKTFDLYRDEKIEVWVRYSIEVKAETIQEAAEKALKFKNNDFEPSNSTVLYETEDLLIPEDNDGQSTVEILDDDKEVIMDNSIN